MESVYRREETTGAGGGMWMHAQNAIGCKVDIDRRQVYIFALVFGRIALIQGIDLAQKVNNDRI